MFGANVLVNVFGCVFFAAATVGFSVLAKHTLNSRVAWMKGNRFSRDESPIRYWIIIFSHITFTLVSAVASVTFAIRVLL